MIPDVLRPIDPTTGRPLPEVPTTSSQQLAEIVRSVRAAQPGWAATAVEERIHGYAAFVQRLRQPAVAERLARSITEEMGKPLRQARAEVASVANRTESFFDRVREACRDDVASDGGIEVVTQWCPLGVVAAIGPWNFPVATPHNLIASALLTGNTCVFKPSEFTPRTGAYYAELVAEHLPANVLTVVQGAGTVGSALVAADVNMVAFTGSIATGQAIMREAAQGMKRLVLELGGKDAMIVLPGANLEEAAEHAVKTALYNCGQMCVAAERLIVHKDVHDEFVAGVVRRVEQLRVGSPLAEDTDLGPLANARQREWVIQLVEDARRKGARVLVEGRPRDPGFFLEPFVIDEIDDSMALARDETFGPVVAIETVESTEQAIERANATRYGLGASVWGPAGPALEEVARRMEAGMVGVNRGLSATAGAPWVGWKMSGFGYSRSTAGMRQFMVPRTISRNR